MASACHQQSSCKEPSLDDIRQIFEETPDTVCATLSRWATGVINSLALQVLFPDQEPEATAPADPEANPDNFQGKKQVGKEPSQLRASGSERRFSRRRVCRSVASQGRGLLEASAAFQGRKLPEASAWLLMANGFQRRARLPKAKDFPRRARFPRCLGQAFKAGVCFSVRLIRQVFGSSGI